VAGSMWVLAEQWRGQLSEVTYELLALGREVANDMGVQLEAVLLGHEVKNLTSTLGAADSVLTVEHPALAEASPEAYGWILGQLVKERQPQSLLAPLTNASWDVLGSLPAQLQMPFVNFCQDLRVVDGKLHAKCLLYGGKMEAVIAAQDPTILGILPGARPTDEGRVEKTPSVEEPTVTPPEPPRVQFKRYVEPELGEVDITQKDVLVSVGRGIQTEDNLELAEQLAEAMGGAVCGSRPVVDQGWLSLNRQVGKSGASVKPKLYLAAGISGAPEHVEGMKNSDLIIAINTDPEAPIFNVAHYGIVEDAMDMLEALTEVVHAKKG
jgi:electron transfer flavoprotein alpha subunit